MLLYYDSDIHMENMFNNVTNCTLEGLKSKIVCTGLSKSVWLRRECDRDVGISGLMDIETTSAKSSRRDLLHAMFAFQTKWEDDTKKAQKILFSIEQNIALTINYCCTTVIEWLERQTSREKDLVSSTKNWRFPCITLGLNMFHAFVGQNMPTFVKNFTNSIDIIPGRIKRL